MDVNALVQSAIATLVAVGWKIAGALVLWLVGRWLIGLASRMVGRALARQQFDLTVTRYLQTGLTVILNVALIVAILGFFGVETTTFAALIAAGGVAIGVAWGGLLANFAAGAFLMFLRPFRVGDFVMAGGVTGTVDAIGLAGEVLAPAPESRPGEIALITDLQASALSPAQPAAPLLVARPGSAPPPNIGIGSLDPGAQPWSSDGGRVTLQLVGDSGPAVPVSARLGNRPARQALAGVGTPVSLRTPGTSSGWWSLTAELDPDELRMDDRRTVAVRIAPVARVDWDSTSRYVAAACDVLAANRRIAKGREVTVGRLGPGISVVQPPDDPAQLGALNRALASRGVRWSYGDLTLEPGTTDSTSVLGRQRVVRRYRLQSAESGRTGVLATVRGAPWIVRAGDPAQTPPWQIVLSRLLELSNEMLRGVSEFLDAFRRTHEHLLGWGVLELGHAANELSEAVDRIHDRPRIKEYVSELKLVG